MNYEIRLGREIWNGLLHIIVGGIIAHVFLAYLSIWWIIPILLLLGAGREYWQYKRGKIQPLYIQIIDTLTLALGGILWWLVITHFNINVDIL
jgi:hypothetical protein